MEQRLDATYLKQGRPLSGRFRGQSSSTGLVALSA